MHFEIIRHERSFHRVVARLVQGFGIEADGAWSQNWYLPHGSAAEGAAAMEETAAFGRLRGSPVYHVVVTFPADLPRRLGMRVAMRILGVLGLVEHECLIIGRGTKLHLVINRVQPDRLSVWFGRSDWRSIRAALQREACRLGWDPDSPRVPARKLRAGRRHRRHRGRQSPAE